MAQEEGFFAERSSFKAAGINPHVAGMGTGPSAAATPRVGGDRGIDQIVGLEISDGVYVNHVYASAGGAEWERKGEQHCKLGDDSPEFIRVAMTELNLSVRAYDRFLRVSRTVANVAQFDSMSPEHVSEATPIPDIRLNALGIAHEI